MHDSAAVRAVDLGESRRCSQTYELAGPITEPGCILTVHPPLWLEENPESRRVGAGQGPDGLTLGGARWLPADGLRTRGPRG